MVDVVVTVVVDERVVVVVLLLLLKNPPKRFVKNGRPSALGSTSYDEMMLSSEGDISSLGELRNEAITDGSSVCSTLR